MRSLASPDCVIERMSSEAILKTKSGNDSAVYPRCERRFIKKANFQNLNSYFGYSAEPRTKGRLASLAAQVLFNGVYTALNLQAGFTKGRIVETHSWSLIGIDVCRNRWWRALHISIALFRTGRFGVQASPEARRHDGLGNAWIAA